jgi:hypothetical protein
MIEAMSDKPQPGVIGSLPSTRPHRRSDKRASPAAPTDAAAATTTPPAATKPMRAKPAAARTQAADRTRRREPSPARDPAPPAPAPASPGVLQTALEATAELTEIGLRASARALRVALSRLPKP